MSSLYPPYNFGVVDDGIFRSGAIKEINYKFICSLNLKNIIVYKSSSEDLDESLFNFAKKSSITIISIDCSIPIAQETVVESLSIIRDESNKPIIITCPNGKHLTGAVVGCYRKVNNWSIISIFEEYRRFNSYIASWAQQQHEQFMLLFDTDLVLR